MATLKTLQTTLSESIFCEDQFLRILQILTKFAKLNPSKKESTHFFSENTIFFNLSLIKKHNKRYYPEA